MTEQFRHDIKDDFRSYIVSECLELSILEESISWINKNLEPQEVFDIEKLCEWAQTNGYVENKD